MKLHPLEVLVPGVFAAAALALALGAGAQTTPPGPPPASPMPGHHMGSTAGPAQDADMKAQCQAMMAKKQEAQDKRQAMDAALDKLVAEMNAAGPKGPDAMAKPMAAVINELVAQRKAMHAMMTEMQPAMMSHMMHHMEMQGTKGMMDCPMMPKAKDEKPTM